MGTADKLPTPFGKYLLTERLASGGMAEVFRAVLKGAGGFEKQVALKRILPLFSSESEFVTLFRDEARIVSSLTHANIAQVFDFGEVDGSWYLVMELVEGLDLARLTKRLATAGQPMPLAAAAFVAAEAARGLGAAHEQKDAEGKLLGIVHRDVSPQNILISRAGEVKVTDFGIAKAAGKTHQTATGVVMGKLRYMSPEQVNSEELDARSDLFSLGVILYELVTGGPIFPGDQNLRLAELIHTAEIPPPSTRNKDVPAQLDGIVLKALARDRGQRYARAAELARDLSRYVSQAAPDFAREDLAALVNGLAPPAASPSSAASLSLEIVPPQPKTSVARPVKQAAQIVDEHDKTDPAPPPTPIPAPVIDSPSGRQLDILTRSIEPRKARRRYSTEAKIGAGLAALTLVSGTAIIIKLKMPGHDATAPAPLGVPASSAASSAAALAPDAAPSDLARGPFHMAPHPGGHLDDVPLTHQVKLDPSLASFLVGFDTAVATAVVDENGWAADLDPRALDLAGPRARDAVTNAYQRFAAEGQIPTTTRLALQTFLAAKNPDLSLETVTTRQGLQPAYSAAALAVVLDDQQHADPTVHLTDLAFANDLLGRWCDPPEPPRRHFAAVLCERSELELALEAKDPQDPTAAALRLWDAASTDPIAATYTERAPGQLTLDVTLPDGADTDTLNLSAGGTQPISANRVEAGHAFFEVPRRLLAPVLVLGDKTYRLPSPPWAR